MFGVQVVKDLPDNELRYPRPKLISKVIQALSKIGDDIYLKPKQNLLHLESVNMTTTAYCIFHLNEAFFSSYEIASENTDSDSSPKELVCKVTSKGILGVFKSHGHKDKKPEFCKIELDSTNPTTIVFKFKYKHDVMAIKLLYLSDGQVVSIVYNTDLVTNQISAPAPVYNKVLSNFQLNDDDMSFDFTHNKAVIRNYITGDLNSIRGIRSQISLMASEFNSFKIDRETNITFSLKPFRAAVHFAESFNSVVVLNFDVTGKPAILIIKNPTFEGHFVIATLKAEDDTQTTLSSTILKHASIKKKNMREANLNITIQDQQALNSINWDNDFDDNRSNTKKKGKFDDIIATLNKDRIKSCASNNVIQEKDHNIIPNSPETEQNKKIRAIFGRCYEDTFHTTLMDLGDVLAADSDPD